MSTGPDTPTGARADERSAPSAHGDESSQAPPDDRPPWPDFDNLPPSAYGEEDDPFGGSPADAFLASANESRVAAGTGPGGGFGGGDARRPSSRGPFDDYRSQGGGRSHGGPGGPGGPGGFGSSGGSRPGGGGAFGRPRQGGGRFPHDPNDMQGLASRLASARMPPHSIEAEQALIGSLMVTTSEGFDKISDLVAENDFYQENNRLIFRAIGTLVAANKNPDVVTVVDWLASHDLLENADGLDYVASMVEVAPSAANVKTYAEIVRERSVLRQMIVVANDIADSAFHAEGRTSKELLDEAETKVFAIADQTARTGTGFKDIKSVLAGAIERINLLFESDSAITGLETGFTELDEMTSGLQRSDLVIVAGRPSMGKTTFAMNIAEHAAMTADKPVAVFSMEMPAEQLALRLISSLGRVELQKIRTGNLAEQDWPRITSAITMLNQKRSVFIDDTPALTPTDLRARSRRLARDNGLSLIVIDYIQLMKVANSKENRATEISEISGSLKALAKELDVPIIALSQLNRSLEQRPDKRPVMSDLRECVVGDTPVALSDGRQVPVRDLVGTAPDVLSLHDDGRIAPVRAECVWSVGVRPVFDVRLAGGREVRCTGDHRLRGPHDWVHVKDLAEGDRLAIAHRHPEPADPMTAPDHRGGATTDTDTETLPVEILEPGNASMRAVVDADVVWDTVVSVEPAGEQEVFDLTVPGTANWLASGIVSHNSGAIEQDADVIMFIYRDEVYNPEDESSHGKAEILIRKQRNGPIGMCALTFLGKFTRFENYSPETQGGDF